MSLRTRAALVLVIGTVLGVSLSLGGGVLAERNRPSTADLTREQAQLIIEVMERVKQDYVEPVDDATLLENAFRGLASGLDPHSAYLTANEYQDVRSSASGRYSGVGLEIASQGGIVRVISPIDGTPAQRAGVEAGDVILTVDGEFIETGQTSEVTDLLRGRAGTAVSIEVRRDNYDDPLTFHLTRQNIQISSVRHEILDESVAYLRLSQFNETTAQDALRAIDKMAGEAREASGQPLSGMIIDLRNNPGGTLDAAVDVSDLFLDGGVIVSAEGRTAESRFRREASVGDVLAGASIAVLVNRGTASASEIVAGALQDHNRATIVGTRTFGKGLVQTVMPLSRGRAIKLTTSHYYTPSGDSINERGVQPDVFVEGSRRHPGQGQHAAIDREGDEQLIEALELIHGKPVMQSQAVDTT